MHNNAQCTLNGNSDQRPQAFGPSGFTLVELLVVVAIISILAAMLLPVLRNVREKAYVVKCGNNLKQIGITLFHYAEDFKRRFPYRNGCYAHEAALGDSNKHIADAWEKYSGDVSIFHCPTRPLKIKHDPNWCVHGSNRCVSRKTHKVPNWHHRVPSRKYWHSDFNILAGYTNSRMIPIYPDKPLLKSTVRRAAPSKVVMAQDYSLKFSNWQLRYALHPSGSTGGINLSELPTLTGRVSCNNLYLDGGVQNHLMRFSKTSQIKYINTWSYMPQGNSFIRWDESE